MPNFNYKVKDDMGRELEGVITAVDRKEAIEKLRQTDFYLIDIKKATPAFLRFSATKKISKQDLVLFSRQFSNMIDAGLSLVRVLRVLSEQTENARLKEVLDKIRVDVEMGAKLSEAFAKHPDIFSNFYISFLKAGETAGMLDKMLKRLADYMEIDQDLRRRVQAAFIYPIVVLFVAIAVVIYLLLFVIPIFQNIYKTMKVTLPLPTVILVTASSFLKSYWWLLVIFFVAVFVAYKQFNKNPKGKFLLDRVKLSIPIFGHLNKKIIVARFIRSFGAMSASGLPILKVLDVAEDSVGNAFILKVVDEMRESISQGDKISQPLRKAKIFPPVVVQMVMTGEETGRLDLMLEKAADLLEQDVDILIKRLLVKVEPALTALLAAVIGFVALAIYLPMFDVIRQVTR